MKVSEVGDPGESASQSWTSISTDVETIKSILIADEDYFVSGAVYYFKIEFRTEHEDVIFGTYDVDFDTGQRKVYMWKIVISPN